MTPVAVRILVLMVVTAFAIGGRQASAELIDSLDAYPPRLQLDTSDCNARIVDHKNLPQGGIDGGGCESVTFQSGVGSEAILAYPIEPVRPLDDLVANVAVMSARSGARIGLRVRFPYFRDPQTRRPISAIIYGATYDRPGQFQRIGVGSIERELRIKVAQLRAAHRSQANLDDPYIDAVAINAYGGPGTTTIRVDQLTVRGMFPIGDHGRIGMVAELATLHPEDTKTKGPLGSNPLVLKRATTGALTSRASAFPQSDVIRILEHQGEPLPWIRSLGFDAILLSTPPTADLLREAIRTQLLVYAPPPVAPDPRIATLLDPVMAWYLGGGVALDRDRLSQTDVTVRRLRKFPEIWQRPIVIAPVENWTSYSALADAIVCDAAPRHRFLPASEQAQELAQRKRRIAGHSELAIAVDSSLPTRLRTMTQAIESITGAPSGGVFRWHSMLTQVIQSIEQNPRAIVFRSHESLVSGTPFAHQRSMALSYTNRFIAMLAPWLATATTDSPYRIAGAAYRCSRLNVNGDEFLLLSSDQSVKDQILAGDGASVEILLPPEAARKTAWRLTGFSAERLVIAATPTGTKIELVSPDVAEIVVISADATLGSNLDQSARRFAQRAASDRWQLCGDQLRQIRSDWDHAVTSGATESIMPVDLLTAASRTLSDSESVFRAKDSEATLRMARRADAWAMRTAAQLSLALAPRRADGTPLQYVSCPPIDGGSGTLQVSWQPLMHDRGWSRNLIATGGLDQPSVLQDQQWQFGRRKLARAQSDIRWVSREYFNGSGALKISSSSAGSEPLGGGYEGTIAMLSSPAVEVEPRQTIRIDAMIRTIGFGGAHQGVLVYDDAGGQEMGILVRGATEWTPVRLYRQNSGQKSIRVMFEVIGDGETVIDEVSVKVWQPEKLPQLPLRPLNP